MDAVEDIKSRLAVEDVVGDYVELKRSGRNLKGLSPFTSEKTPSFMVSPEKQIWHDFSSGRGGDMFSFVMELEGLDFRGALELLARKSGVDLEQYRTSGSGGSGKLKERVYAANEAATRFYQVQFSKNKTPLEYVLKKRGFSKDTALTFRLGYAPSTGRALYTYLTKQGFTGEELKRAGLVSQRGNSDLFRERLMVPLMDGQGRVVGFTGRILTADPNAPKYMNTPQSPVYDKSRHVFAFHLAKDAIREKGYCVIVEGNLDVVAAHQADTRQVVATAGTALTEPQLKILSHFSTDIRLCFDQDRAGQEAAERSIGVAGKVGVSLGIIDIPAGKDPDELIQSDVDAWRRTIDEPLYAPDWLIKRYEAQLDISSAQGKREFSDVVLRLIRSMPDAVEQDHYLGVLADKLEVTKQALRRKLEASPVTSPRKKRPKRSLEELKELPIYAEYRKLQQHFMALALYQPALRATILQTPEEVLEQDSARVILEFLRDNPDYQVDVDGAAPLEKVAQYAKILALQYEELYKDLDLLELRDEAARVKSRLIEHYVKYKKQALMEAFRGANESKQAELLTRAHQLDTLLRN
jgi:DNA primase